MVSLQGTGVGETDGREKMMMMSQQLLWHHQWAGIRQWVEAELHQRAEVDLQAAEQVAQQGLAQNQPDEDQQSMDVQSNWTCCWSGEGHHPEERC